MNTWNQALKYNQKTVVKGLVEVAMAVVWHRREDKKETHYQRLKPPPFGLCSGIGA